MRILSKLIIIFIILFSFLILSPPKASADIPTWDWFQLTNFLNQNPGTSYTFNPDGTFTIFNPGWGSGPQNWSSAPPNYLDGAVMVGPANAGAGQYIWGQVAQVGIGNFSGLDWSTITGGGGGGANIPGVIGSITGRVFVDKNGNGMFDGETETYSCYDYSTEFGNGQICSSPTPVPPSQIDSYLDGININLTSSYGNLIATSGASINIDCSNGSGNLDGVKNGYGSTFGSTLNCGANSLPGRYAFINLPADLVTPTTYTIKVNVPSGYRVSSPPRTRYITLGSCIATGGCLTLVKSIDSNGSVNYTPDPNMYQWNSPRQCFQRIGSGWCYPPPRIGDYLVNAVVDFALQPITGGNTVSGKVCYDSNGNNQCDSDEAGLSNATVTIGTMSICCGGYGTTFTEYNSADSDSTGNYSIPGVPSGTYKFRVYDPPYTPKPNPPWLEGQGAGSSLFYGGVIAGPTTINFPMGGPIPSPTPTGTSACGVSGGSVYIDTGRTNCSLGATAYTGASSFSLNNTVNGSQTGTSSYPSTPATYTVPDNSCSGSRALTLSAVPGNYRVIAVRMGAGQPFSAISSYTTPSFTYSSSADQKQISWCLAQGSAWYQVDTGDVRMPSVVNLIYSNKKAATNSSYPGIFISSLTQPNFGGFTASEKNWQVGQEYSYNSDFKKGLGGVSYTFYDSRAKQLGQNVRTLGPGLVSLTGMTSGVWKASGSVTISGSVSGGTHIVLLVNGTATISGDISVPTGQGNLLVVAAKGDIVIPDNTTSLNGIYSSEGSIRILSRATCSSGFSDLQLTVNGALIANSLYPFETGQSGQIRNQRDLCDGNVTSPSLIVLSRPEFLTQMTDFYKTTYKTFREVEP